MPTVVDRSRLLILAADRALLPVARKLAQILSSFDQPDSELLLVERPSDAVRRMYVDPPAASVVCTSIEFLHPTTVLIDLMRSRRPHIPVLAVSAAHNNQVEQSIRAAGASFYFPLDDERDALHLRHTLNLMGLNASPASIGQNRAPPHSGAAPPPRARGRPPDLPSTVSEQLRHSQPTSKLKGTTT